MASGGLFSINIKNPYDKNHLFRMLGSLAAFVITALNAFILVFYYSTDEAVAVKSRWGLLLVVAVEGWVCTWFQFNAQLCNYAGNPAGFSQYDWRALFESAYGGVERSTLCEQTTRMMLVATSCWAVAVASALVALCLTITTRMKGNPEIRSQQHYEHCYTAIVTLGFCMVGIALPPIVFTLMLPNYSLIQGTPLSVREGVFVGVLASLAILPPIFGYHIDRSVLKSKMEFENLIWAPADDSYAAARQALVQNIDFLEQAKFGGLVTPTDLARQAAPEANHGVDKYLLQRAGPWR